MRHFLAELLAPDPPRIEVADGEDVLEVGLAGVSERLTGEFTIRERHFKIEHLKLKSPERTHHMVHFCADRRSVRSERIKQLPDGRLREGHNEFFYHAYVISEYLDSRADQQRTGFAIEEEADLVPEPSFGEIRTAVYDAASDYLESHLRDLTLQKEGRISRVLDETFPEQAYLRHQNQRELERIPLTASEDDIRDAVARIHFGNVRSGRALMESIVEDMKKASTIDFASFQEKFGERLGKVAQPTQANLASYLLFRRRFIDMYREIMKKSRNRFEKEAAIHHLILPMGTEYEPSVGFFPNNLWLLDERLTYASYIASDRPLGQHKALFGVDYRDEPDVVCYFNLGFSSDDPAEGVLRSVVIVEFKRPGPLARHKENPWQQVLRYIDKIREGFWNESGQRIKGDTNTRFYCYIVCDLDNDVINELVNHREFTPLFDGGEGYFRYNSPLRAYVELVPFERMLRDAERKHRAFFEHLGLEPKR